MVAEVDGQPRPKKRALCLAGGGPAAGFHIGALAALEAFGLSFDVWSLSCIGAWVGIYYNQLPETGESRAARTYDFFRSNAFRDTASYRGFPVNKAFAPNLEAYGSAWLAHVFDPQTYVDVASIGGDLPGAMEGWHRYLTTPEMWFRKGDRNAHVLNDILALHPMSRFLTSMMYLSGINGLSNIYYKDSTFLDGIDLGGLDVTGQHLDEKTATQLQHIAQQHAAGGAPAPEHDVPEIKHNAWRLRNDAAQPRVDGALRLFNNKWADYWGAGRRLDYLPITHPSLCACSALPYVEQTVQIPNDHHHEYSEGALVDTVSFRNLVEDHADLDEIWVCRIVDYHQVRLQANLHDSLGNLCEQFAAEVGENDIDLFKTHLRKTVGRIPRVVEVPLQNKTRIDYRWDHANLDFGCAEGFDAVLSLLDRQPDLALDVTTTPEWGREDL